MGSKVYLNGEYVEREDAKISVFDHGLLYGDGVFEGIRSYNRKVFKLKEHIDRLYKSAECIRLKIPITKKEMSDVIIDALKKNDLDNAYIRVLVTRGKGDLGLDPRKCGRPAIIVITDRIALYPEDFYEKGLPIVIAGTRRNHPSAMDPRIKSLNYLNNIFGKIDAIDAGCEEALMLSVEGYVVECTGDNLFIYKDGELITPYVELGSLEGITQKAVMDLAREMDIPARFAKFKPEDVYEAEECFLTGTAAEIIPVIEISGKTIGNGRPGKLSHKLRQEYKKMTAEQGTGY